MIQDKKIQKIMSEIGINETETRLYLELLRIGTTTITDLGKITATPRTTVHQNVEKLIEKGLIAQTIKGKSRMLVAEEPNKVKVLLADKKVKLEKELTNIENISQELPDFVKAIYSKIPNIKENTEVDIRVYEGKKGLRFLYQEVLKAEKIWSFVNVNQILSIFPNNAALFKDALEKNSKMEMWEIVDDSNSSREHINNLNERYYFKFVPDNISFSDTDLMIFNNQVAIIDLTGLKPVGLIINSESVFKSLKALHQFVWNVLPD